MHFRATIASIGFLTLAACLSPPGPEPTSPGNPAEGAQVAQDLCASCHAVGMAGASPNSAAPPFRTILSRYDQLRLVQDLQRAAAISHRNMPTFIMTDQHAVDLVAYIATIQGPPADR